MDIYKLKFVLGCISAIIGTVFLVLIIVFRFSNPELTETQLFISNWYYIIGMFVFYVAAQILLKFN